MTEGCCESQHGMDPLSNSSGKLNSSICNLQRDTTMEEELCEDEPHLQSHRNGLELQTPKPSSQTSPALQHLEKLQGISSLLVRLKTENWVYTMQSISKNFSLSIQFH